MELEQRYVPLASIRPSGQNPRREFGDIEALAGAIRATGGEPVNPPVVVEDGNVYRIVDGERRWRALKMIYGAASNRRVRVLVAPGLDEANEAVAMLATDDKRLLTEEERARGVQQMLVLGVEEERIARAGRVGRRQVEAARKVAPFVPEGAQVTLDQMLAASELSEEDAAAVLAAGGSWRFQLSLIRARERRERRWKRYRDAIARSGVPVLPGPAAGAVLVAEFRDYDGDGADRLRSAMEGLDASCCAVVDEEGGAVSFFAPEGFEPVGGAAREESERGRAAAACADLATRMARFALTTAGPMPPEAYEAARDERSLPSWLYGLDLQEEFDGICDQEPPSRYEAALALARAAAACRGGFDSKWMGADQRPAAARRLLDALDLFRLCGFEPSEGDAWLVERARAAADGGAS